MKKIFLTLLVLSNLVYAQQNNSSSFTICSSLTDAQLQEKLELSTQGVGSLYKQDDKNGGLKFKLKGAEDIVRSVQRIPGAMSITKVKDLIQLFENEQQYFEMTKSSVSDVTNGGQYSNLFIVIRPLPKHIRPAAGQSHEQYYVNYMLKCKMESNPVVLECKRNKKYKSFLVDEVTFKVSNKGSGSSKCGNKNMIEVKHESVINNNDYNKLLGFITKELTGLAIPSKLMSFFVKPEDMSDDMMDDYLKKLYEAWTK